MGDILLTVMGIARSGSIIAQPPVTWADRKRYSCTRGLRSVPFLVFANMSMTNACAFHLSVMLLSHRLPESLLAFLPSGKSVAPASHETQCKGIIYLPNEELQPVARRLLDLAETAREDTSDTETGDEDSGPESPTHGKGSGGKAAAHTSSEVRGRARRSTMVDGDTKQREIRKKHQIILERAKKLLLIDVLKTDGVHSAEIWSVAFRMMAVARSLLLEEKFRPLRAPEPEAQPEGDKTPKEASALQRLKGPVLSEELLSGRSYPYPIPMFAPGMEDFEFNFPAIPKTTQTAPAMAQQTPEPSASEGAGRHARKKAHAPRFGMSNTTAKEFGRFGLPMELWRTIVADAVGANGILSKEQQSTVIRYAADWNALEQEISIQGAAEHQQIWKILDTVGCFAYTAML